MRTVRLAIFATAIAVLLLPAALLAVAWVYEQGVVSSSRARMEQLALLAARTPVGGWPGLAERERVRLRRLDRAGQVLETAGDPEQALTDSPVGHAVERALRGLGLMRARERLEQIDPSFGPPAQREELASALRGQPGFAVRTSESGQTVVVAVAAPLPDGGAVELTRASHRGVRQLLLVRAELGKLVLYQSLLALVVLVLLTRWLVRPLEQLARGAAAYAGGPLVEGPVLLRRDEVGQLARAMSHLAHSLDARQRAAAELAADLAHELKNPLATIAASSELIASTQDASSEKRARVHAAISGAVDRLRRLTDELLALARFEATLAQAEREWVDYHTWVEQLLAEYRKDPRWTGSSLVARTSPEVQRVRLAPKAWERLLRNLIDNALEQPGSGREVVVSSRRDGTCLVTEVSDNGPGVSPGNREKIFRRFFTHRPEGAPQGTGLGLSIVQSVAEAHGGKVELVDRPGPGSTFRVTLQDAG